MVTSASEEECNVDRLIMFWKSFELTLDETKYTLKQLIFSWLLKGLNKQWSPDERRLFVSETVTEREGYVLCFVLLLYVCWVGYQIPADT